MKDSKYAEINSINSLSFIFNKVNEYFEEIKKIRCLTLVPTNENKGKNKKYEKLWIEDTNLISSITKNSNDYDEKYIKI